MTMRIFLAPKTVSLYAVAAAIVFSGSTFAAKPPSKKDAQVQANVAAQPRVGDEVNVVGRVVESYEWLYKGVPMQRLTLSHPTIDGVPVHAAYLTACKGLEEQCAAIKYHAASTDGVALVSDISAYGVITTINVTQYYSDYYLDATSDISN